MLPKLSLRLRLLLIVLVPVALLAAGLSGFLLHRSATAADAALRDRAVAIVSFLGPAAEYGVFSGNRRALGALLGAVLEQPDVAAASILDADGVVLASSGRRTLGAAAVMEHGRNGAAMTLTTHDGRLAAIAAVTISPLGLEDLAEPTVDDASVIGWVHVEIDTGALESYKHDLMTRTLAIALIVLLITLALAWSMSRAVSRPLAELVSAVRGMSRGKLDSRVAENAEIGEVRALQHGFNRMADAISDAHDTMQTRIDEATEKLAHQAMHDALTGLPNRRAFEQALEAAVGASRRASDASVLCFMDLDRFKTVNDTAGHAAGDALLTRIAAVIRERVRTKDLLARIGGDEFALILYGCTATEAHQIADNLRQAVEEFRFDWQGQQFGIGLSIGLVPLDGRLKTPGDALVAADLACYAAKRGGRNRIVERTTPPGDSRF
jgi:diguanylate cyclase (GGDEF)-like protein